MANISSPVHPFPHESHICLKFIFHGLDCAKNILLFAVLLVFFADHYLLMWSIHLYCQSSPEDILPFILFAELLCLFQVIFGGKI
jgi:hypothetical protein